MYETRDSSMSGNVQSASQFQFQYQIQLQRFFFAIYNLTLTLLWWSHRNATPGELWETSPIN